MLGTPSKRESHVAEGMGSEQLNGSEKIAPEATLAPNRASVVFISYASHDTAIANALCQALEREGVPCWLAPRNVRPGDFYADAIVQAINACQVLVLVLSQAAIESPHVLREVERASAKKRPVITFRIDTAPLPPALEYFVSASQWLDSSGESAARLFPKLIEAVRSRIASAPQADHDPRPPDGTQPKQNLSRTVVVGTVVIAAALAYFVADRFWLSMHAATQQAAAPLAHVNAPSAPTASDISIAVLPFVDMSEKKDQEYFADGIAEEVLDLLARLPGIRVIGRTSSFQFHGGSGDLRAIGKTLGASYVVEGSVRKAGDRLRVTAQLVSTQNGSHLWSESYDEPTGNVLKVQDRIAAGLVRALQVTVGADDLRAPAILKNTEAYDLYLRGRHALDRWDRIGFESAAGYFQQALELDPTAERAAEWLAFAQSNLAVWSFVPPREGFEHARLSAQRALELNPQSGGAHAILASTNAVYDWDWPAAEHESQQALALEPRNSFVIGNVGFARSAFAQPEESARLMSAAIALDPLNATWNELLGQMRYRAGRLAEAEALLHKVLDLSPTYAEAYFYLGQILLAQGNAEAALVVMGQETPENGRDTGLAIAYHALKRRAESDAALARLTKEHASDSAYEIAQAHAYRGELDEAFAWLDRAYRQKDVELYWIKGDPLLKNLEPDPRYSAFLHKMKLLQ